MRRAASVNALACICALASPGAQGQSDLGFEDGTQPGWRFDNGVVELDTAAARSGRRGLYLSPRDTSNRARFAQDMSADSPGADRLRISAYIKGAAGALWVRVDGDPGLLYVDSTRDRVSPQDAEWTRVTIDVPLSTSARRISFGGETRGAPASFDDFAVERLRADSLPVPGPAARRYVERALSLMQGNSVRRRSIDWDAFRAAAMLQARGASSVTDAHLAVRYALAELHDGHSYFMAPRQMKTLAERPVGNARTGRERIAPRGALLWNTVGYVALPGFAGGTHADQAAFAQTLQRILADVDAAGACGWILDLRGNSGGNLWPMLTGIGPLLGDGEAGASISPNGERTPFWYRDGKAGLGDRVQLRVRGAAHVPRDTGAPVAVVMGRSTASAAEVIAGAFEARPATRSFGAPTRGAVTATRIFPLADGAALVLAVGTTADRHGRVYEGPIQPDERIASGRDSDGRGGRFDGAALASESELLEHDAVRAAREWLFAQRACGRTPSG